MSNLPLREIQSERARQHFHFGVESKKFGKTRSSFVGPFVVMLLGDSEVFANDSNTATGVTGDAEVVLEDESGGFGAIHWSSLTFGCVTDTAFFGRGDINRSGLESFKLRLSGMRPSSFVYHPADRRDTGFSHHNNYTNSFFFSPGGFVYPIFLLCGTSDASQKITITLFSCFATSGNQPSHQ